MIGSSYTRNFGSKGKLQDIYGISDTLVAAMGTGGGNIPIIIVGDNMNKEKPRVIGGIGEKKSNSGRQWYMQDRIYDNNIAISIATSFNPYYLVEEENMDNLRIRKLTPKECWRLMGFGDSDFDKASKVNSNTQLYKQAGNSIVVNVLEAILYNLLVDPSTKNENIIEGQTTIFDFIND